jgi:hypothetical protein
METQLKVKLKEGVIYPERNSKPLLCPHYTRLLVPSRMAGAVDLNSSICSSQCMKFKLGVGGDPDRLYISICDTGIELEAKISVLERDEAGKNLNII